MTDWTKNGSYSKVTVYRYGLDGEFYHLCFYNDRSFQEEVAGEDERYEFEITSMIGNMDMLCMVYPYLNRKIITDQLDAWINNTEVSLCTNWAVSVGKDDNIQVKFYM